MLDEVLNGVPGHDFVRLIINNSYLNRAINLPFLRRHQINAEAIFGSNQKCPKFK